MISVPYSVNTALRVPMPMLPKAKKELDCMVARGVIRESAQWCGPMVLVHKRNKETKYP